jgi:hypothetical protein
MFTKTIIVNSNARRWPGWYSKWYVLGLISFVMQMAVGFYAYAEANGAQEYSLKASYLTLFSQYTTWPDSKLAGGNTPITICVLGLDPFKLVLEQSIKSRKGGPPLAVKRINTLKKISQCHIVFIAKKNNRNEGKWLAAIKGRPILTVGESVGTLSLGAAVVFKIQDQRIQFSVNLAAVELANLQISAEMLIYASEVQRSSKVSE